MADERGGLPSIGLDMSKLPLYGQDDERLLEISKAQKDAIAALEKRYQTPNWFKVAAGFAKPQLGGFTASLGSAAEALGENVELQRASQLPIAQMRLQLAQSNMLLGASKKVNDELREWAQSHPGQTPPASLIRKWAATSPDNPTVKALQAELENAQRQQTLNVQRIQQKQMANMPLTADDMAVLNQNPEGQPRVQPPDEGAPARVPPANVPPAGNVAPTAQEGEAQALPVEEPKPMPMKPLDLVDEKNKSVKPTEETKKNSYKLPNGVSVTEDVYDLAWKHGLPVISNLRTPEEQEKLKHHKENGRWYTKEGNPVGEDSKHFSGDAMDIDSRALTAEQRKALEDNGWYQPKWATDPKSGQYDPNHWERKPAEAKEKKGYYPHTVTKPDTAGMGQADRELANAQYKENAKALELPYADRVNNLSHVMSGPDYTKVKNNYNSSIKMIESNPKVAEKVFAMVRNSEPLIAALNQGVGIHAGTLTANINLPVKAYLDAGLSASDKAYADKLFSSLLTIAISNLKQQGAAMGKVPQGEYMNALSQFVNPDMTYLAAINSLHHQQAEFNHNKEYFDVITKERKRADPTSPTPLADIHNNSEDLPRLSKKYSYIHQRYDEEFNKELDRLRKQGK